MALVEIRIAGLDLPKRCFSRLPTEPDAMERSRWADERVFGQEAAVDFPECGRIAAVKRTESLDVIPRSIQRE